MQWTAQSTLFTFVSAAPILLASRRLAINGGDVTSAFSTKGLGSDSKLNSQITARRNRRLTCDDSSVGADVEVSHEKSLLFNLLVNGNSGGQQTVDHLAVGVVESNVERRPSLIVHEVETGHKTRKRSHPTMKTRLNNAMRHRQPLKDHFNPSKRQSTSSSGRSHELEALRSIVKMSSMQCQSLQGIPAS